MFLVPPLCSGLKLVVLLICSQGIPLERKSSHGFMSSCWDTCSMLRCKGLSVCHKALENQDMPFGNFSSSEGVVLHGKKTHTNFLVFSYCLVAQHSKISFPQITDETGTVEELEVSCGSICTSVVWSPSPQFSSHWALSASWILFSVRTEAELS